MQATPGFNYPGPQAAILPFPPGALLLGRSVGVPPVRNSLNAGGDSVVTFPAQCLVPGGIMGPNSALLCQSAWSYTNSANNKNVGWHLNGVNALTSTFSTTAYSVIQMMFYNAGATNLNKVNQQLAWATSGASSAPSSKNLDTSQDFIVAPSCWWSAGSVAGESITLEHWFVWMVP